jgi:hypothetical protein
LIYEKNAYMNLFMIYAVADFQEGEEKEEKEIEHQ